MGVNSAIRMLVQGVIDELRPAIRDELRAVNAEAPPSLNPPNAAVSSQLLSVSETAAFCGVVEPTIRAWIKSGRLRASRLGGGRTYRIRRADLDAFLSLVSSAEGGAQPDPEAQAMRALQRLRKK